MARQTFSRFISKANLIRSCERFDTNNRSEASPFAMAGLLPNIPAMQATAVASGRSFDVGLALTAPTPRGWPPANINPNAWNGPAPLVAPANAPLAGHNRYCNDRTWHLQQYQHGLVAAGVLLFPQIVPGTLTPCSSLLNPSPAPAGAPLHHQRRQCLDPQHGGVASDVCSYCINNTRNTQWFRAVRRDVDTLPPLRPVPGQQQPIATWKRFLTYLCNDCEIYERKRWRDNTTNNHTPANNHTMIGINRCQPPWNTCRYMYISNMARTVGPIRQNLLR